MACGIIYLTTPSHNLIDDRGRRGSSRRQRQQQHRPRHAAAAPFPLFMTASSSSSAAAATAAATALVGEEKKRAGEVRWEAASASIPHPRKADTGECGLCVVWGVWGSDSLCFLGLDRGAFLCLCIHLSSKKYTQTTPTGGEDASFVLPLDLGVFDGVGGKCVAPFFFVSYHPVRGMNG